MSAGGCGDRAGGQSRADTLLNDESDGTMSETAPRTITIESVMRNFRDSLRAVIPMFEKVELPWKEPDAYDQWDDVATALYNGLVATTVNFVLEGRGELRLPRYNWQEPTYANLSFIGEAERGERTPLVCLQTSSEPFDMCAFANLSEAGGIMSLTERRFDDVKFVLCPRLADQTMGLVRPSLSI